MSTIADPEVQEAAERSLRCIFHGAHELRFRRSQVTLDAAIFAFQAIVKVDQASRSAAGLYKLWSPIPVRSWTGIPKMFVKAVLAATKDPGVYKQSKIGLTAAITHRRNLQAHLDMPDVMPCPGYR